MNGMGGISLSTTACRLIVWLWLFCCAVFLLANISPVNDGWRVTLGGRVKPSPSLGPGLALGQAVTIDKPGGRSLEISFATYRKVPGGRVVAYLLTGGSPPGDSKELHARKMATISFPASAVEDNQPYPLRFPVDEMAAGGGQYYLFIHRIEDRANTPLSLWLAEPGSSKLPGPADIINLGQPYQVKKTEAHLTMSLTKPQSTWLSRLLGGGWGGYLLMAGILVISLGLTLRLGPDPVGENGEQKTGPDVSRPYDLGSLIVLGLALVLILLTFRDYGVTLDEEVYLVYGQKVFDFFASGFTDWSANEYRNLYLYGGLFDGLAAALAKISPLDPITTKHLFNALVGWLGLAGVWRLTRSLAGSMAGFFALLLLLLTPAYYGHMFNNMKDLTFAVGYVWALHFLIKLVTAWPELKIRPALWFGLTAGAASGIRIGGFLLPAYLALALAVYFAFLVISQRKAAGPVKWLVWAGLKNGLVAAIITYLAAIAAWPFALADPLVNPLKSLSVMTNFPQVFRVLYKGLYFPSTHLPGDYVPHHLLIKLPEPVIFLLIVGGAVGAVHLFRRHTPGRLKSFSLYALITFSIVFPVFYTWYKVSAFYDGVRHMLFIVPPLICLAGAALARLVKWLGHRSGGVKVGLAAVLIIWAGWHISLMVRLHPYQYLYYNQMVGGLAGADGRYETDYWAGSTEEALQALFDKLKREYGQAFKDKTFYLKAGNLVIRKPDNIKLTGEAAKAHFVVANTRWSQQKYMDGQPMVIIERLGVPLVYVFDRRDILGR